MYKSILLAADGSDNSFRAAKETLNFVNEGTKVTILNVIGTSESKSDVLHSGPGESVTVKRKEKLARIIDLYETNNVPYTLDFKQGEPKETVVKVANSGEHQAVVLGTRGLNSVQEMVLGSVSHKVAKRAEIPVIIIK
ncbi:universal stress protein [Salinicoccus roseus]|uniref:universal stress protein n=1 Tax=Salinicoccus roseus TaxID=45670 RepID=UPI001EF55F49|nr:universal stress protein [Salinicoccus roseus]MCG7333558.1 universal stress protein [Salinicoccus roseus]